MLKQLDDDRNIVMVLTQDEYVRVHEAVSAGLLAADIGVARLVPEGREPIGEFISAAFLLTDEELLEAQIKPHREHGDPAENVEKMAEILREEIAGGRQAAINYGFLPA